MQIAQLIHQHDELELIAAEISAAIDSDKARPIAALRWRLARALIAHLAIEDRWLYPALIQSEDKSASRVASQFQDEMGDLATVFRAYMAGWTDLRIAREWADFCDITREILRALHSRIIRENETLYPAAKKVLGLTRLVDLDTLTSPTDDMGGRTAA